MKRIVEKHQAGEIVDGVVIEERDFNQIKKFIALLCGEEKRNGISFAVIAECLELDQDKLNDLYSMVLSMREVKDITAQPPPGYKWKLVKENLRNDKTHKKG